jgi:peptidoglycan/xylan/chitin deacetylase (PgdA/CDA1 family)
MEAYEPDRSLKGKLRRRLVRLAHRRPAHAAPGGPMVSFSFDDAPLSAAITGAEILGRHGVHGTYYLSAGLAGQDSPMGPILEADDARRLAEAGHEIGCHTHSHLDCGQAAGETAVADVARNGEALTRWSGAAPTTFAYPYGDVSAATKRVLAPRFSLLRALHHGLIEPGADLSQAPAVGIEGPHGEVIARSWLQVAVRRKGWLILYTHDVAETPSPWGCTPQALDRLAAEAVVAGCSIVTVAEGARLVA